MLLPKLDQVTQQDTSVSEQMAATSEVLARRAEVLQSTIAFFRVEEPAARPTTPRSLRPAAKAARMPQKAAGT